jgi:hypothetical protein
MTPDRDHARKLDRIFAGGIVWSAGAKAVTQLLSWTSVLMAARILSPADFGLAGMAGVFFVVTNVLAEFGLGSAVLQMQELERDVLAQIHAFACLFCTGIFLAGEAASPLIASFFKSERLLPVLLVNNLTFLITGFQQVPLALLQREMDYRRLSFSDGVVASVQAIATIVSALAGLRYWALVLGMLAGKTAGAVLNYYWQPIHFRVPCWNRIHIPVRMGGQIAISRLAWSAYTQSDGVVVGRMLGDSLLGTYQMAMTLATAPAEKIGTLIMRAAGPLFAKIQNDQTMVRRYFLIITEAIGLSVFPLVLGLAAVAPDAIRSPARHEMGRGRDAIDVAGTLRRRAQRCNAQRSGAGLAPPHQIHNEYGPAESCHHAGRVLDRFTVGPQRRGRVLADPLSNHSSPCDRQTGAKRTNQPSGNVGRPDAWARRHMCDADSGPVGSRVASRQGLHSPRCTGLHWHGSLRNRAVVVPFPHQSPAVRPILAFAAAGSDRKLRFGALIAAGF